MKMNFLKTKLVVFFKYIKKRKKLIGIDFSTRATCTQSLKFVSFVDTEKLH